jgi:SNF2 family DNA or RNA helicase
MIALHVTWLRSSGFALWGEDSELPAHARARRGRPAARPRPRAHPFAAPAQRIASALAVDGSGIDAATLTLPSCRTGPQASPQLLRSEPVSHRERPDRLDHWTVPAVVVDGSTALEVLLDLPDTPGAGVAFGPSLRFATEIAKLALELVARGQLVPALERRGADWIARWLPLTLEAPDQDRLALLAAAMPPLVRCAHASGEDAPAPQLVVGECLALLVDAAARGLGARIGIGSGRRDPVEAWLVALTARDPTAKGDPVALAALAEQLDAWRAAGEHYAAHRTFRTCFRVSVPDAVDGTDPWRIEFLLQAKGEPSLVVPAADVWSSNGGGLRAGEHEIADPQERLLGGLGHALRVWPALEPALREPAPTAIELQTGEVFEFLRESAPALDAGGFGILAPPWWEQRVRLRLEADPLDEWEDGGGLFSLEGLCRFQWRIAVGDTMLTLSELRELAALKLPLVMNRGRWILLRPEDVEAALAFFERNAEQGEASAAELVRASLTLDATDAPETEVRASGWLQDLLAGDRAERLQSLPTPAAFVGELRPYQQRGLSWMAFLSQLGLGACLADDMGLGKTVQLLALLLAERDGRPRRGRRRRIGPTLLICPMSVVGNWEREAVRFAPTLRVHVHHGRERRIGAAFKRAAASSDLVITTYALAGRDRETLGTVKWGRVALDEAQNIKTIDAKQTRAIRAIPARHRVALTGTPVENRLTELHSLMDFLNPGLLGPAATFKRVYARPIERYRDELATARLRRATGPFILRRLKTDKDIISDLPEKIEMRVDCRLTREQATLYQAVVEEMLERAAHTIGIERSGVILGALTKLKQVCNHPAHVLKDRSPLTGRSGKLAQLEEILTEALAEGDRALCFTQFAEFGHVLRCHLQEQFRREVLFLHGATAKRDRDMIVERFQSPDGPPIFVLSLKAGGTGLNLTAANHVIHYDRWWNPAVEDQATDRAFRIGQKKNVQVRKLTCVGTLEERIDTLIAQKKDLAERIVGTGEGWVTELDADALRELVALSIDAVAA